MHTKPSRDGPYHVFLLNLFHLHPYSTPLFFSSHTFMAPSSLLLFTILLFSSTHVFSDAGLTAARRLDSLLRNLALHYYHAPHPPKTGRLLPLHLPTTSLSATAARFRSGSLRRYGATILEFSVGPGTAFEPYAERLLVVRQRLDASLSPSSYYPAPGYRLLSPVLGLLFYNPDGAELRITSITRPIAIDFSESAVEAPPGAAPVCAFWDLAGHVSLSELAAGGRVCSGYKEGHYGLLVEEGVEGRAPAVKRWKMAVGGAVGGVVGVVLLLLLVTAMVKKKKRRVKMEEMERRAYEEEAVQVSMVGHVRAPVASGVRTLPVLETKYSP